MLTPRTHHEIARVCGAFAIWGGLFGAAFFAGATVAFFIIQIVWRIEARF